MPEDWLQSWLSENGYATGGSTSPRVVSTSPPGTMSPTGRPMTTGSGGTFLPADGLSTPEGQIPAPPRYDFGDKGGGRLVMTPDGPQMIYPDSEGGEGGGEGGGAPPSAADLRAQAQEAWMMEQLAQDPLYGLQVNQDSALASAQADPESIAAQRYALGGLRGIHEAGGWTEAEQAQNRLAQQDSSRYEQSQRAAVQQQAAMRGMNQSGAAMMGALSAQQGGANRAADSADRFAIAGQQRALQSLMQYGNQAGQMRGQSWTEDTTRRGAADEHNRYRTDLIQGRQREWGDAQGASYGGQQSSLAGLTGQWDGSIDRGDRDADETWERIVGAATTAGTLAGS
jgi:hypothetical protein